MEQAQKRAILIAIMIAMFLGAIEGTVITTAIPTIVKDLNGFDLISWVFSLYFLTSAISTPVYGKLADLYGRRNTLSFGILLFLLGSLLCGISQSIYQLIFFRALQGLGAGAIFTVSYTIIADIFPLGERVRVQGWLSAVWGIASLTGPFLGGFLIDVLSWHWIFFINLPFGLLCIVLLQKSFRENFEKKRSAIDYSGIILLSLSMLLLLAGTLALGDGSGAYPSAILLSPVGAILLLIRFYYVERKAQDPVFPFEIFKKTNILANAICFLASAVLIGSTVYMPIYIQNVLGFNPIISGLSMVPMSVAWLLSSFILARWIPKYGAKAVTMVSGSILAAGCLLLWNLKVSSPLIYVLLFSFISGAGFGGIFTTLTIVVQSSVDYGKRGAATASNSLLRTLGQTIGVSALGGIFNAHIQSYFERLGLTGLNPQNLLSLENGQTNISAETVKTAIHSGLSSVFGSLLLLVLLCLLLSLALPARMKNFDSE